LEARLESSSDGRWCAINWRGRLSSRSRRWSVVEMEFWPLGVVDEFWGGVGCGADSSLGGGQAAHAGVHYRMVERGVYKTWRIGFTVHRDRKCRSILFSIHANPIGIQQGGCLVSIPGRHAPKANCSWCTGTPISKHFHIAPRDMDWVSFAVLLGVIIAARSLPKICFLFPSSESRLIVSSTTPSTYACGSGSQNSSSWSAVATML